MGDNFEQPLDADAQRASDFSAISSGLFGALDSIELRRLRFKHLTYAVFIFVIVNVVDQLSKQWARTTLSPFANTEYFGGLMHIRHSENPGAFLSLGATLGDSARFGLFTILVVIFLIWACWMVWRKAGHANMAFIFGWSLLIAGGFGNLIDRAMKSTVTDFLVFGYGPLQTGVLNVADMAITFGIIIVLIWGREMPGKRA